MFSRALPVTGSDKKPHKATISTFVYAVEKGWLKLNILSGAESKKNSSIYKL